MTNPFRVVLLVCFALAGMACEIEPVTTPDAPLARTSPSGFEEGLLWDICKQTYFPTTGAEITELVELVPYIDTAKIDDSNALAVYDRLMEMIDAPVIDSDAPLEIRRLCGAWGIAGEYKLNDTDS